MAASEAPTATVVLDRERTLCFDLAAVMDLARLTRSEERPKGVNLIKLATQPAELQEAFYDVEVLSAMLCALLLHEDESLTPYGVARMVHPGNLSGVMDALGGLFDEGMPEMVELKEGEEPADPPA